MKKHIISRTLSFLLALTLIFAAAPLSAFGAGTGDESESESATATTYGSMADTFSDLYWLLFVKPFLKPSASGEGLPENAKLSFETVSNPFNRKTGSVNYDFLDFYDIKAVDKQTGKEIHPEGEVEVTITDARIKDGQSVYILHILDDENVIRNSKNYVLKTDPAFVSAFPAAAKAAEKATGKKGVAVEIIDDLAVDGNDITFKTNSFSIFIIAENPILTVNFYKGPADDANKIVSIRVKKSDTEGYPSTANPPVETEFEKIVYDPGVNSGLEDDILFRGWFENNEYDVEDATRVTDPPTNPNGTYVSGAMTIADVRDKIAAILNDTAFDGGEKNFFAMLYRQYTVTYFDQAGKVCLGRDFVLQRAYSANGSDIALDEIDYQVTLTYVPYGQFENFEGWKLKTGDKTEGDGFYNTQAQHMVGIYTDDPDGTPDITGEEAREHIYTTPTWTRISGDIYLQAEAPEGNWLVFDENGKGGTYVAPQFVKKGENTISPDSTDEDLGYPVTMQRYGYEFGGWFTTKAAADNNTVKFENWGNNPPEGAFTFGQQLTANTTVYASWIPNTTANYTVLIWKQNVSGNGYDFAESVTITGTVGGTINSVTSSGTGNNAYATVNGTRKQYTGFHLKEYDQNVSIVPEGTSILNVYYDRNVVTLTFQVYRSSGGTYVHSDATSGTLYGLIDGEYKRIYSDDNGQTWYYEGGFVEDENGEYGLVDGNFILLTKVGDVYYYTDNAQYNANTVGSPKFGVVDGQYVQLIERNGSYYYVSGTEEQYVETFASYNQQNVQYRLVSEGVYEQIYWHDGWYNDYWFYYTYTANTSNGYGAGTRFALVDGEYVQLRAEWRGQRYRYYLPNSNQEYTGTRYERNEVEFNGTRYLRQEVDIESEYTDTIYTHSIPYTGTFYAQGHAPYSGERFTYTGTTGWQTVHKFTGLYGSTLAANGYTWPTEYWWYEDYQSGWNGYSGDGTRTTFLDAFILAGGGTEETFYGFTGTGNNTIRFYKQNPDGSWPALNAPTNTVTSTGGTFYISDKYNGYRAVSYSTNGTNWSNLPANPGTNGYYDSVGNFTNLYIRFESRKYNILFMDGQYVDGNNNPVQGYSSRGELHEVDEVAYSADLTSYNKGGANYYVPDDFAGFVFEGWYLDDACTHPYTFTTMTEGITVYAKWRQIQYRVFLHPNAGEVTYDDQGNIVTNTRDETLDWGSSSQSMNFRVSYGGTISVPTGLRDDYVFAGWYTDPGLTQSFIPVTVLNDATVTTPYDKTTHFTDVMDKWGNLGPDPFNSDLTGWDDDNNEETTGKERFWITKEFNLYAKWRARIVGADGMYVRFVTTDDEGRVGHFASGTANANAELTEYCDGDIYADGAFGYGLAACDAPAVAEGADELHFRYWVVQRWDASLNNGAGGFFDSDIVVYPGQRFVTVYQYAQRVDIDPSDPEYNKPGTPGYDEDKPDNYYKYYMVLRAEYTPAIPAETTVRYHANGGVWQDVITGRTLPAYGSGADVVNYAPVPGYAEGDNETYYGFNIEVNKEFNILQNTAAQTVVEKEGYNFLGWSFTRITTDAGVEAFKQTLATETAEGYEGERTVFAGDGSDPVVGADLRPDEANVLYAVWELRTFDVIVKKVIANFQMTDDTWNQHGFMFYYSVTKDGETLVADTLVKEGGVSVNGSANTGDTDTVIITNVPYGATLRIWEVLQEGGEQTLFLTDHDADNKIEIVLNDELALKDDGRTLAAPAVITNTGALGTIIVSKTVTDKNGTEFANEKFVFKLERLTSADGAVDATFAPVYFTLKDTGSVSFQVPSGYYRVTELTEWSWRYDAEDDITVKKCTIDQDNSTARAEFTNKRNDMNWLSGENSADNTFVVSNGR